MSHPRLIVCIFIFCKKVNKPVSRSLRNNSRVMKPLYRFLGIVTKTAIQVFRLLGSIGLNVYTVVKANFKQQQHPFNGRLSGTTLVSQYEKGKTSLDLLEQEIVSGSGISWATCKSAPCHRQLTTPASHHSVFTGWMPFLPPSQQHQSTES